MSDTIYLVDDDLTTLRALTEILEGEGYRVRPFASAEAFLEACTAQAQGCVVLDVNLPGLDGLQAQRLLREQEIDLPVIFLTGHGDVPTSVRAMKSGAVDFLQKPVAADELIEHVRSALREDETRRALRMQRHEARQRLSQLTAREFEVLDGLLEGKTAKVIARALGISPRTVEVHRKHILLKTSTSNLMELDAVARLARTADRERPMSARSVN